MQASLTVWGELTWRGVKCGPEPRVNAMDAMQNARPDRRALLLRTARDGRKAVRVEVRDSGAGVSEGDLGKIFQAFYTTKADGMGLGLAITRSIVEAHGGRLEARNNADGGATFSFTLSVDDTES